VTEPSITDARRVVGQWSSTWMDLWKECLIV